MTGNSARQRASVANTRPWSPQCRVALKIVDRQARREGRVVRPAEVADCRLRQQRKNGCIPVQKTFRKVLAECSSWYTPARKSIFMM